MLMTLLVVLAASQSLYARQTTTISVALAFSSNESSHGSYSLSIKGATVYLNGDKLTSSEVVRFQPYLTEVMTVLHERPADPTCAAGKFKHVVVRNGHPLDEQGCLDDPRFRALLTAFEQMTKGRS